MNVGFAGRSGRSFTQDNYRYASQGLRQSSNTFWNGSLTKSSSSVPAHMKLVSGIFDVDLCNGEPQSPQKVSLTVFPVSDVVS